MPDGIPHCVNCNIRMCCLTALAADKQDKILLRMCQVQCLYSSNVACLLTARWLCLVYMQRNICLYQPDLILTFTHSQAVVPGALHASQDDLYCFGQQPEMGHIPYTLSERDFLIDYHVKSKAERSRNDTQ